jgi:membrane-bound serine protease (ClpP class)
MAFRTFTLAVAAVLALAGWQARAQAQTPSVVILAPITGVIGPPTALFVADSIRAGEERSAKAVILQIDTPGGLDTSMRKIIADILGSKVPVVGYVAPSGGRAASAGTYILYATNIAAMAPGTNVGAATPVQLTPVAGTSGPSTPPDAHERKAINDAAAFMRSLAELRHRNAEWGEEAVRGAAAASAREALRLDVIDLVANDLDDLLDQIDGRAVTTAEGVKILRTRDAVVQRLEPSLVNTLLALLVNPNVAFILMMLGVYGLIFELSNPGLIAPGVAGAVALVLGLYGLDQLPLNYAALALILIGMTCMVVEAFIPTYGALGVAGIVAFLFGAWMLTDTEFPQYRLAWGVIVVAIATGGFIALALGLSVRALRRPIATGAPAMIGLYAQVHDWEAGSGHVEVLGERWRATGPATLSPSQSVRIVAVEALSVRVADPKTQGEST